MLTKHTQDFLHIATLLRPRVEFSVRVSTGSAFAKGIIALGVHHMLTGNTSNILATRMHVTPSLQHDGAFAQLYQAQSSKQSAGTGTHNDDRSGIVHLAISHRLECGTRLLSHINHKGKIDIDGALASINAATTHLHGADGTHVKPQFASHMLLEFLGLVGHFGHYAYVDFFLHNTIDMNGSFVFPHGFTLKAQAVKVQKRQTATQPSALWNFINQKVRAAHAPPEPRAPTPYQKPWHQAPSYWLRE